MKAAWKQSIYLYASLVCMVLFSMQAGADALVLNSAEQQYLDKVKQIRLCTDPDWLPYEGIDEQGEFIGIMADFHQLWADKIKKPVVLVPTSSWSEALRFIEQGHCDLLSSAQHIQSRSDYLDVSQPFISYPLAIATQPTQAFILNLTQIKDKKIVMVKGYAAIDMVKQAYPTVKITPVKNAKQALKMVEKGQAFAYIDTVPSISYQMMMHGISLIEINGVLKQHYDMSVGVRHDLPVLLSIYNKVIEQTTEDERRQILNQWLSLTVNYELEYKKFLQVLGVILALLALFGYHYFTVRRHNSELQRMNKQLEILSHRDQLTGIHNRYHLHQVFKQEQKRVLRFQHDLAMVILDIDSFKHINDTLGHATGDKVLKSIAKILQQNIRVTDELGRWGGEEFLILCPETDLDGAATLAENIRQAIERHDFGIGEQLTASFGVAPYLQGEALESCIKRADQALYKAKEHGKNTVYLAQES